MNTSHFYSVDYNYGQSIDAIRSEVKLSTKYNINRTVSFNQGVVSNLNFNTYSVSPSITTEIGNFLIMKYDLSYINTKTVIRNQTMPHIHNFTQNLSASVIPVKKLILNISFNHYFNSLIQSSARSSWFGNAGIKYKLKNVDLMIDCINVFNTRRFVTYSYNDVSSYYSEYKLRPTEVLLRVRFKIM